MYENKGNIESLSTLISKYLFAYRNSPHCSTGDSPAQRLFGRNLRSRLDLLKVTRLEEAADRQVKFFKGNRDISFSEGERVMVRDYKNPMKPGWQVAKMQKVLGERTYLCKPMLPDSNLCWRRHTDQIIKTGSLYKEDLECYRREDEDRNPN